MLNNDVIQGVTHTKYLGVVTDSKLSWSQHVKEVTRKLIKSKDSYNTTSIIVPHQLRVKANCYKPLVKSILEYACVVWAPHTEKDIKY